MSALKLGGSGVGTLYRAMARYCPHLRQQSSFSGAAAAQSHGDEEPLRMVHDLSDAKMEDFLSKCPFAAVMREHGMLEEDGHFSPIAPVEPAAAPLEPITAAPAQCPKGAAKAAQVVVGADEDGAPPSSAMATAGQTASRFTQHFSGVIDELKREAKYREFAKVKREAGSFPCAHVSGADGQARQVEVWCSNDYLAMGQNAAVLESMQRAVAEYGAGSGGTRNISGNTDAHVALELELAALHGHESALLFGSCYAANATSIRTVAETLSAGGPRCVIFSDEKNHASLIEGIRAAGVEKRIFRHNDVEHLRELLREYGDDVPKLIVFESVYSMDGTVAPIREVCDLAEEHNGVTFLDEVHAVGLYGRTGGGIAERDGQSARVDIVSGTLGKAIGVYGGYLTGRREWIDVIRCRAPGFIFSTSLPPVVAVGALESVRILRRSPHLREEHQLKAARLKQQLASTGIPILDTPSHIVPVMVGDAALCKRMGDDLLRTHGIYVQPINYPTVDVGTERFRLTPGPQHTACMMDRVVSSLASVWDAHGLARVPYELTGASRAQLPHADAPVCPGHDCAPEVAKSFSLDDISSAISFPELPRAASWIPRPLPVAS